MNWKSHFSDPRQAKKRGVGKGENKTIRGRRRAAEQVQTDPENKEEWPRTKLRENPYTTPPTKTL